jgi:hypothetical protein
MSGGSYDYLYRNIGEAAGQVNTRARTQGPLRAAFAKHLLLVAEAMRKVEWVDSCDSAPGDEDDAIRACLAPGAELESAREALVKSMAQAQATLDKIATVKP